MTWRWLVGGRLMLRSGRWRIIGCRMGCRMGCRVDCRIGCRITGSRSCEACGGRSRWGRGRRMLHGSIVVRLPSLIQLHELLRSPNGVCFNGSTEPSCGKRKQGEDANGVNHFHFGLDLALEFLCLPFRVIFRGKTSDLSSE